MNKRNLVLQAAVAMALGAAALGAQAGGTLTPTAFNVATQNFGPTSTAALAITPGALTYTFSTPGGIVLNDGGVINMYFRLGNGAKFAAAPAAGAFATSTIVATLGLTAGAPTLSTDGTTIVVPFTNSTGGNVTIGVGATAVWVPAAGAVNTVNTVLNTAGGTIGATASASVLAANANAATLPADVDGPAASSVNIATAASAFTTNVTAGGTTAETQKIDVTASPSQTLMTTGVNSGVTNVINFGSFKFTDVAGVRLAANTGDYTVASVIANSATSTSAVATGNFAAAIATGGSMKLGTNNACTAFTAAGSTATLSSGNTVATWTGVTTAASAAATYVCMTVNGTTVIPATTPTLTATLAPNAATGANTTASGTLYALGLNGSSIDVRSYVPAAVSGYSSYVRIVNSGTAAAPVSVAVIDPVTGTAGTSNVLISSLPAGAATTLTAAQVEAVTGAIASASRPRLRITAPTSALQVQSFMSNPNGTFSEMSGGQLSNIGATTITGN